jgi:hypothetical protein
MLGEKKRRQLLGVGLIALAFFVVLSLIPVSGFAPGTFPDGSIMGVLGAAVRDGGTTFLGLGIVLVPLMLAIAGAACFGWIDDTNAVRWGAARPAGSRPPP